MKQPTAPSLPPRKWYTLEQAVKRINKRTGEEIEVADLLHYWKTNQLEICTAIDYRNFELYLGQVKIEMSNIDFFDIDFFYEDESYQNIRTDNFYMITTGKKKDNLLHSLMAGMIILMPNINFPSIENVAFEFIATAEKGINTNFIDYLITEKEEEKTRFYFKLALNNQVIIPFSSLFILNNELELFLKGRSNAIETIKEIENKQEKRTHTKTLNTQAEFIRNLITIHYGEKVANNIRNELENPRSRITCEFEKNGLKAPSGKAVDRWINQP